MNLIFKCTNHIRHIMFKTSFCIVTGIRNARYPVSCLHGKDRHRITVVMADSTLDQASGVLLHFSMTKVSM